MNKAITKFQALHFKTFSFSKPFTLESGRTLPGYHLAYTTLGKMNAAKATWCGFSRAYGQQQPGRMVERFSGRNKTL